MLETVSDELLAYQQMRLKTYQEVNGAAKEDGIVFAGDSIIEFFPLKKYFGRELTLYNRGIAGMDSKWLQEHILDHICHLVPSKAFILIGTNDIGLGYSNRDILSRMIDIMSTIKSESIYTKIHLISVLPVSEDDDFKDIVKVRNNAIIDELNQQLATIPGLEFIDANSALKDESNNLSKAYTKDGLHLNADGYQKLSDVLKPYLD